jgi:hypothetical protein
MQKSNQTSISEIYQVLMAISTKVTAFWDIALCGLEKVDRCFRGAYCSIINLMMEAVCSSEASICYYEATWYYIPEGCYLQTPIGSFQNGSSFKIMVDDIKCKFH